MDYVTPDVDGKTAGELPPTICLHVAYLLFIQFTCPVQTLSRNKKHRIFLSTFSIGTKNSKQANSKKAREDSASAFVPRKMADSGWGRGLWKRALP